MINMNNEAAKSGRAEQKISDEEGSCLEKSSDKKKCPFCAELIQSEAIKCRYCGEFFDGSGRTGLRYERKKWYHSSATIILVLLFFGALVIPFVWKNPYYKITTKILITIIALAYTACCLYLIVSMYLGVFRELEELGL